MAQFAFQMLQEHSEKFAASADERRKLHVPARIAAMQFCEFVHRDFRVDGLYRAFRPGIAPIPIEWLPQKQKFFYKERVPRFFAEANEKGGRMRIRRTWREIIQSNYWVENLLDWEVPEQSQRPLPTLLSSIETRPIIDFEMGSIDLSEVRNSLRTARAGAKFERASKKQGVQLPMGLARFLEHSRAITDKLQIVLQAMEPFEPFPLVIREEDFSEIVEAFQSVVDIDPTESEDSEYIVDQIVNFSRSGASMTKRQIYHGIGGQARMSWRRFQMYWIQAAEVVPELSKSGRKPRNRNG